MIKTNGYAAESKTGKRIKPWIFPLTIIAVYSVIYWVAPDRTLKSLEASGNILKQTALPLLFAFVMMFLVNLFITPAHVSRFLGSRAGIKGILLSSAAGILSMGPIYAWFPFLKTLREKGTSDFHLANFMAQRAIKPVFLPLMIIYFGWQFSMIFTSLNILGALLVAAAVNYIGKG